MQQIRERFRKLAERWFLSEPAFLSIYGSHALVPNACMDCPVRCGQGRLEYHPELIARIEHEGLFEELVRAEMLRLLLKHPYNRTPEHTPREDFTCASDIVLSSACSFRFAELHDAAEFRLPGNKHYEWYLTHLPPSPPEQGEQQEGDSDFGQQAEQEKARNKDTGEEQAREEASAAPAPQAVSRRKRDAAAAALWEEDEARQQDINQLIEQVRNWGSIPGNLVQEIIAGTRARIDYRKVLSAFRASILSQGRRLTRMQPNRRTGFACMGSRHAFTTSLLLAVDVSLSVSDDMLAHFYSVINKFFKYGVSCIDVIQFDTEIKGEACTFRHARKQKKVTILGRGGTNYQPVFDYVEAHRQYDGLIILTDGYAPPPARKPRGKTRVAWVCENEESFNENHAWMAEFGKVCFMNLK